MILPSNNISILDVRQVLNEPSTDLGTLCTSNNINIFSKYKPIHFNAITLSESNRNNLKNYSYATDKPAPYGIRVLGPYTWIDNSASTTESILNAGLIKAMLDNDGQGCIYYKPEGGENSPYRLGDFRGYNHNATPPITPIGSKYIYNAGNSSTHLESIVGDGDDNTIGINELYDYYDGDNLSEGTIKLYRGIYMIYEDSDGTVTTDWCVGTVNWANKPAWQGKMNIKCYDFLTTLPAKELNNYIQPSSLYSFYAVASDTLHPNGYTWYLTGEGTPDSMPYGINLTVSRDPVSYNVKFIVNVTVKDDLYSGATIKTLKICAYAVSNISGIDAGKDAIATVNYPGTLPVTLTKTSESVSDDIEWGSPMGAFISIPATYKQNMYDYTIYVQVNSTYTRSTSSGRIQSKLIAAQYPQISEIKESSGFKGLDVDQQAAVLNPPQLDDSYFTDNKS